MNASQTRPNVMIMQHVLTHPEATPANAPTDSGAMDIIAKVPMISLLSQCVSSILNIR